MSIAHWAEIQKTELADFQTLMAGQNIQAIVVPALENAGSAGESPRYATGFVSLADLIQALAHVRRRECRSPHQSRLKRNVKHRPAGLAKIVETFGFTGSPERRAAIEIAVRT